MSETAVFLIHPLWSQKYFWALWSSVALFDAGAAPLAYGAAADLTPLYHSPEGLFVGARELRLTLQQKTAVYRQIRRSELPAAVQADIKLKLMNCRQQAVRDLLQLGFRESDLVSLTRLKRRYRELLRHLHPDHGGSAEAFRAFYAACQGHLGRYQAAEMRSSS
jgi:hypothetical protein